MIILAQFNYIEAVSMKQIEPALSALVTKPLDPLSALPIGASVVQFVDFAYKIVLKGRELYDSPNRAIYNNEETETIAKRFYRT